MIGLVLEGGGARGSYQAGAIKALRKNGIRFSAVVGTSIGSINGAFVASNNYKGMYKLWNSVKVSGLFGIDEKTSTIINNNDYKVENIKVLIKETKKIIKNSGVDTSLFEKVLKDNISEKNLRKSDVDYGLVTFNLHDLKPVQVFKKDIPNGKLHEYILASSYFPLFKFKKIIDDKLYFDGGIYNQCPFDLLYNRGLDTIYIIRAHNNRLRLVNDSKVKVVEIKSKEKLGPFLFFTKERNIYNFKLGYYDTIRILKKMDGKKYYIKYRDEEYYKNINKKYTKKQLIEYIEDAALELKINRFRIYNINVLLLLLKFKMLWHKNNVYYKVIKNCKISIFKS